MERLYQYLWKHRMLGRTLTLDDGRPLVILSPGVLNTDAGPDFRDSRIRIGSTEWAGNVEIHVRASDWHRHGHDSDPAYHNVILHVVSVADTTVTRPDGTRIPQLTACFPKSFFNMYAQLSADIAAVKCGRRLDSLSRLEKEDWLETLAAERMQGKAARILDTCRAESGDWERTCFLTLARALGFGLNGVPFEMMARSLPLNYLARHSDNPIQLEALLFGQAGMLDTSIHIFDEYYQMLCREYFFLARKYGLRPIRSDVWKYARTRPGNFPHRRIALLAKSLTGGFSLMAGILEAGSDPDAGRRLFDWHLDGYWTTHSDFDREAPGSPANLSEASINLLLINLVAPLLYAYGSAHGDPDGAERGLDLWHSLAPENNTYIRQWKNVGLDCDDAMRSQALIQLRREYCDKGRCLDCRFGHALLRHSVTDNM